MYIERVALPALFPQVQSKQTIATPFDNTFTFNTTNLASQTQLEVIEGVTSFGVSPQEASIGDSMYWLVGARLRQLRVSGTRCEGPDYLTQYVRQCDPEYSFHTDDRNGFGNSSDEAFIYRYTSRVY